jgi:hypothetical protein
LNSFYPGIICAGMSTHHYIAFEGTRRIAAGSLAAVAAATRTVLHRGEAGPVLVFDARTSEPVEIDVRGSKAEVVARAVEDAAPPTPEEPRGPGRPKLGVVPREVTLLPRHWDWLAQQPGGASAALRRLVEEARRSHAGRDGARQAKERAYRFMSALAGGFEGFEEASRALFAHDAEAFAQRISHWPPDVRAHLAWLARDAFAPENA